MRAWMAGLGLAAAATLATAGTAPAVVVGNQVVPDAAVDCDAGNTATATAPSGFGTGSFTVNNAEEGASLHFVITGLTNVFADANGGSFLFLDNVNAGTYQRTVPGSVIPLTFIQFQVFGPGTIQLTCHNPQPGGPFSGTQSSSPQLPGVAALITRAAGDANRRFGADVPDGIFVASPRIADNQSPVPRDRVFFNYNYFDNTPFQNNGYANFDRFAFGLERTIFDSAPDPRMPLGGAPYASGASVPDLTLSSDQILARIDAERRRAEAKALEGIEGAAGVDAFVPPLRPAPLWHGWVSVRAGEEREGPSAARLETDIAEVVTGAFAVHGGGVTGGYLKFRDIDGGIAGELDVDGEAVSAALFHIRPLGFGLTGKALVYFETGDADVTVLGGTGAFDFDAWQIEGEVTGTTDFGNWWITHRANLFYYAIDRDGFVTTAGTAFASDSDDALRLSFGPTFAAIVDTPGPLGPVSPFLRIEGEWDIVEESAAISPSGTVVGTDDFNIRLTGGAVAGLGGLGTGQIEASFLGGGGGDDEAVEVRGSLAIPLN